MVKELSTLQRIKDKKAESFYRSLVCPALDFSLELDEVTNEAERLLSGLTKDDDTIDRAIELTEADWMKINAKKQPKIVKDDYDEEDEEYTIDDLEKYDYEEEDDDEL